MNMRWIQASERMPENSGQKVVRYLGDQYSVYDYTPGGILYFGKLKPDNIEWLDEIGEGSESYWKKRCLLAEKCLSFPKFCNYEEFKEAMKEHEQLKSSIGEETEGQDG